VTVSKLPDLEAFATCVGDRFQLDGDDQKFLVELIEAEPLGDNRGRPFALLFRVEEGPTLPQKIYPLEHDRLGRLELFLVPVGPDEVGMRYEAVFS
jgi:hypothetical protein